MNITLKIVTILNTKKLQLLEKTNGRNNIEIFELLVEEIHIPVERVCNKVEALLGNIINKQDIINIYQIGKTDKSLIKVEFL